jgi:DNA invertase Pin-like site-specific DNA recombinase
MQIAKAKGRLRGKQPKLNRKQEEHLVSLFAARDHTVSELAELFSVSRGTVYRALEGASVRKSAGSVLPTT